MSARRIPAWVLGWTLSLSAVATTACTDNEPMDNQRKYRPWGENTFFADQRAMRPLPPRVVPRESPTGPEVFLTGRFDGEHVRQVPVRVDLAMLERGRHHFEIYCATCHGLLADGDSPVARNMPLRPPPSLLVHQPHHPLEADGGVPPGEDGTNHPHFAPGFVFEVITEGYGFMPSYANELHVEDRWAVIAYLGALRLSQTARLAELPPDLRSQVEGGLR